MVVQNKKTVLITGASTGIGKATALYFQKKGWNVVATMRKPDLETTLTGLPNVKVLPLDVTDPNSIQTTFQKSLEFFGGLDVVVNNAGYGLTGPFEGATQDQIRRQYETNVFGVMNVIQTILPYFRSRKQGVFVNIASMGGRIVFPYYSLYHGTKWAVEGFTESLRFELEPLGIKVRIVEPGAIKTDFYERSNDSTLGKSPSDYLPLFEKAKKNIEKAEKSAISPEAVAKVIYKAGVQGGSRLRYAVGPDAKSLLFLRRFLPDSWYAGIIRMAIFR